MNKFSLLWIITLLTAKSYGCICWFDSDKKFVEEKIHKADVILYATAVTENSIEGGEPGSVRYISDIVFKVDRVWKGKNLAQIKFEPKKKPCEDADYKIGERYIIFGYLNRETRKFETNICNSLSEETRPDPIDERKISKDFDVIKYQRAIDNRRQKFRRVTKLIVRRTR